jgi:hypothetical protein
MSTPLVIITTHRLPAGRRNEFDTLTRTYLDYVDANEPRVRVHWAYVDADQSQVSLVQVHPDADSADEHMRLAHELIGQGLALVDTVGVEVYGEPGPMLRQALVANASAGVSVTVRASSLGGVVRP